MARARRARRVGARIFREADHRRDRKGRFTDKLGNADIGDRTASKVGKRSVNVRVSPRSVTASIGKGFPIVPGRVRGFVGVLGRVEYTEKTFIEKTVDKVLDKAIGRVDSRIARGALRKAIGSRRGSTQVRGAKVSLSVNRVKTPQIRISRNNKPRARRVKR